jgi:predicted small lipoprotein YifL
MARQTPASWSGSLRAGGLVAAALALVLSGCGVRGSLESPQGQKAQQKATADSGQGKPEDAAPKPHKESILDGLIR